MIGKMKALALYLPAFHQIPENDRWWGEGFTEWDNVRSGQVYYPGQIQPVRPKDDNYYDLSKVEDIRKQISLAQEYDVAGFVMYHYWFSAEQQLFTKPAELLRDQISDAIEYLNTSSKMNDISESMGDQLCLFTSPMRFCILV